MAGKKEKAKGLSLRHEILCVALIAFALYLAVSLFSDSSFSNWGGVIGRHISNGLLKIIGYTAYLLPFIIIAISFDLLLRRILSITTVALASVMIFILSSSALFSAVSASGDAGGIVGAFLSVRFAKYLGATGSIIILSAVVIITLLVATGLSLVQAGVGMYPPVAAFLRWMISKASGKTEEAEEDEEDEERPEQTDEPTVEPVAEKTPQAAPAIITQPQTRERPKAQREEEERIEIRAPKGAFTLPAPPILDPLPEKEATVDNALLLENSKTLEKKLMDFGVEGRVVEVRPGPVVTMYEFEPASGIKVNRIVVLADDLALAMKATSIRIVAPIPGKSVVGIEVPNQNREMIKFREVLESPAFSKSRSRLSLALGKDISGSPFVVDLVKMPHMLVAGATGAGKSVAVNGMILSILFKSTPEDVRFLMVDPKMLELSAY
ncbi:MAG: DNA translocase FtsK 4TM domain-containing protein, partial [Deltaproteobacteria bacterium]|nr:DNA translocase FtsK 4TM domain-containing protein [Deltaproteobacteria bacterium]